MTIPRTFVDELLSRTDIAELIGSYVQLKKSGSNIKGLCPFHTEKTPSFMVNDSMQIYKCFGCGKGGNALTFVMEFENLQYTDAVEVLARRAGMTVPEEDGRQEYTSRRKRILELNRDAARHFHRMLTSQAGQAVREYLAQRGVTKASVTKFGLGAAPEGWTHLLDAMTEKGYTRQELLDAGLVRKGTKADSLYDFFRNRVIFPVIDVRGEVIAFSGRSVDDDDKGPKYLNSPDTVVFSKNKTLFGLNLAKKSKAGMIILVEGNFDVVMMHQAGFDNTVAQLGSAFTPQHARILAQYTDNIILAFDSDEAGRKATLKTLPLIEETGKNVRVINLSEKDPDEYIRKNGAAGLSKLIERGENHAEYRLQEILRHYDISTDAGRLSYFSAAADFLSEIPTLAGREIYSAAVAKTAAVSVEAVKNEVERLRRKKAKQGKNKVQKAELRPRETVQPANREIKYQYPASAVAEEGIIRCLMKDQSLLRIAEELDFKTEEFTSQFLAKAYTAILNRYEAGETAEPAKIISELETAEAAHFTTILDKPEPVSMSDKALKEYIKKIRIERLKREPVSQETLRELEKIKGGA